MGMKFLIRENRHSIFTIRNPVSGSDIKRVLENTSLINFSTSGTLYTLMILCRRDRSVHVVAIMETTGSVRVPNILRTDDKNG
ncbi:Hypothetical protein PHPALM_15013, partial [Phytophthora palmivora]